LEAFGLITGTIKPPHSPQDEQASPSKEVVPTNSSQDELDPADLPKEPSSRVKRNHPQRQLIGDINEGIQLRNRVVNQVSYTCYLSQFEPKRVDEALQDESWIAIMRDELHWFTKNDVWTLVPKPSDHNIIKHKMDIQEQIR